MKKNIADIARIAGVAKSTVSRYLNGGSVSEATRRKIEQVIKDTGYIPNTFAQSLKAKKTSMIGAIVPRLDSFASSQTVTGMDEELRELGYQLLIINTGQDLGREIEALHDLARQKISGIVLFATQVTEKHLTAIREINVPVMLLGQQHNEVHSFVYNDYMAGYEVGRYVLSMGHRKIAYLGVTERDVAVGVQRKEGFRKALAECADPNVMVSFYESGFKMSEAVSAASAVLGSSKPSVIVCATDNIALGVMKAASMRRLRIPEDLSVTGFGGYDVTEIIHPGLTTVKYNYAESGHLAAKHIVKLVNDQQVEPLTVLGYQFIERESVDKK
ncbi:LacI family DNA-binding transcriptional regulator [Paenibacillus sp. DMB20]|uniref:LacI family DNA-binding transcriptional regulator n=1 Tax=Paenibacillus sp. DMB20 TaxID=1642570 RepID=UPI0006279CE7|nr:LacI family DNA-binding transcriptional regulator [Paenibacillus sp. DMB20]KKO52368.1 LacI family transcriptional regulator [Paenibacillus sp. DMB20]